MSTAARVATRAGGDRRGPVHARREIIDELAERIGVATNNVAEYRALLRGLERAAELGARSSSSSTTPSWSPVS